MSSAWIQEFAERAIDPVRVRRALEQMTELLPDLQDTANASPDFATALAHLLSVSPISAEKLKVDPEALAWLAQPEIAQSERGPRRMRAAFEQLRLEAGGEDFDESFRALRRWKAREMLRIALREVAGWSSVEQTTFELALVAELCVQIVTRAWLEHLGKRWGRPATGFAVLGMGKFGGQELNYSSDIDVIFFYGEDGQLNPQFSHKEFFTRLSERIIATFSTNTADGALFRIDLRLRPEGASGPLARSLDSIEHYYAAFGETWERMALSKARVVGGDEGAQELGYEFGQRLQAFIYPRTVSLEVLEEVRALKVRIEREIVGRAELRRNVKLGYGGIREIEFVTQTLQLLHGAKHAFLQERSTLKALRNLQDLDLIPAEDMETLIDAYRWLRTVEHRLQIEHESQTHLLPEQPEARARLAASLGYEDAAAFDTALTQKCAAVRAIFDKVLGATHPDEPAGTVDLSWFGNPANARRALDDLGGGGTGARFSPRTKQLFARLETPLFEWLRRVADPDTTLTSFVRFVERYGSRGLLYETLLVSPRVLEVLIRLFDASRAMTDIVLRRPQLLEEIARGEGLGDSFDMRDYLAGLERNDEGLAWQDALRAYRRGQFLRIGLRDLLGFADVRKVREEYSALAEACVVFALRRLGLEDALTVVAMGKFGGGELGYGADLDVLFIGKNNAGAAELMRALSTMTAEGRAFPVDARLRPEGEKGPLTCSLESYEDYFAHRGQLWEAQALTKARPIGGPQQHEFLDVAKRIWRRFGAREELFVEIARMHERIRKERVSDETLDFKTGRGGLMQVEFFIQGQQMRAGLWANNTLEALAELETDAAAAVAEHYLFLRKVEGVLRLADDTSVSKLPKDELEQRRLAIRCGFNSRESFLERMENTREDIARLAALSPIEHE